MDQLLKGKTTEGKWFVRPITWAGEWNEKGELMPTAATLVETPEEEMANQYMAVYKLVHLVDEEVEKNPRAKERVRVYEIEECEWWVSSLDARETAKAFCEEYGKVFGDEVTLSDIKQVNDDTDGMFWTFDTNEEISRIIASMLDENSTSIKKYEYGNLKCSIAYCEGPAIFIPFSKAIRLYGEQSKPYMIACSEC